MADLIIIDRRGANAQSYGVLRRSPTYQEVANLFQLGIETSHGWSAALPGEWYWKVIGFSLNEGPVVYRAEARDGYGNPLPGIKVIRHYPTAPMLQNQPVLYANNGIMGITEFGGDKFGAVEFQYTRDSVTGPGGGPDSFWVVSATPDDKVYSDMAFGLGWLGGTNHLNPSPIFQLTKQGETPEPPPQPEPEPEPQPGVDRAPELAAAVRSWLTDLAASLVNATDKLEEILRQYE